MKPELLILSMLMPLFLISTGTKAQSDEYTNAMMNTIQQLDQEEDPAGLLELANRFERIANAEKSRWIPYYYASYSLVVMSFIEEEGGKRDQVLDRAQELLDQALQLEPDESELHVLQAFLYPSRIMVDPMGRGMTYIEKAFASLERAKTLNPKNPRIYFLEGVNRVNLPPSMGGGADAAKPILEEAMLKFETEANPDPLWPHWGKEATQTELEKLQ